MNCQIKICGITNLEDAQIAADLGVEYLGFNFYNRSKRYIIPDFAADVIKKLPISVVPVGLFVNSTNAEINQVLKIAPVKFLQFHGDEDKSFVSQFRGYQIIKALRIKDIGLEHEINEWLKACDYVLLDAYSPTQYGGTGEKINQTLLDYYKERIDFSRVFLAGGLNPENVSEVVTRYRPYAVDVASGVEIAPGRKDSVLVNKFVSAIRSA